MDIQWENFYGFYFHKCCGCQYSFYKKEVLINASYGFQEQAKTGSGIDVVDLKNISPEQAGNYTCVVTNVRGKDWISFDVQVLVPPQQPNVSVLETFHDSLRISWVAGNNGGSRIKGINLAVEIPQVHTKHEGL